MHLFVADQCRRCAACTTLTGDTADHEHLLSQILTEVNLGDADDDLIDDRSPWEDLYRALRRHANVGPVTASKLIARKRPCLAPIRDRRIVNALFGKQRGPMTRPLRDALAGSPALIARLGQLRLHAARFVEQPPSLLRLCDIALWMSEPHSTCASRYDSSD